MTRSERTPGEGGRIEHAELELDGGVVMLGSPPGYSQPSEHKTHMTQWWFAQHTFRDVSPEELEAAMAAK